jgi:hypothetical protein
MQLTKRFKNLESGQSMVEFAMSAMIIFTLLVGVADFGRAFFTYLTMRERDSADRPVNLGDTAHVSIECIYVYDVNGDNYIDAADNFPACGTVTPVPGQGIKVRVVYDNFMITTPLLGSILGTQTLTMRAEVQDTILRIPNNPPPSSCPDSNE